MKLKYTLIDQKIDSKNCDDISIQRQQWFDTDQLSKNLNIWIVQRKYFNDTFQIYPLGKDFEGTKLIIILTDTNDKVYNYAPTSLRQEFVAEKVYSYRCTEPESVQTDWDKVGEFYSED